MTDLDNKKQTEDAYQTHSLNFRSPPKVEATQLESWKSRTQQDFVKATHGTINSNSTKEQINKEELLARTCKTQLKQRDAIHGLSSQSF